MNTEQKISRIRVDGWDEIKEVLAELQKQIYAIEERLELLEDGN